MRFNIALVNDELESYVKDPETFVAGILHLNADRRRYEDVLTLQADRRKGTGSFGIVDRRAWRRARYSSNHLHFAAVLRWLKPDYTILDKSLIATVDIPRLVVLDDISSIDKATDACLSIIRSGLFDLLPELVATGNVSRFIYEVADEFFDQFDAHDETS